MNAVHVCMRPCLQAVVFSARMVDRDAKLRTCSSCDRSCISGNGRSVSRWPSDLLLAVIPSCVEEGTAVWICNTCSNYIQRTVVPPLSMENSLRLPDIDDGHVLHQLNIMERRLIARVHTFTRIVVLSSRPHIAGQTASKGITINFPSDVATVVDSLPRPIDDSGIIMVSPSP